MSVPEQRDPRRVGNADGQPAVLPISPGTHPSYAHATRAAAEAAAREVEGRVVEEAWDPQDGDGPRRQWHVIDEGKHPQHVPTYTHRDSAGRPV
ncbi:MAG: hypothetical protein V3V96_13950 [Acidiferrobacterales bacterium]